MVRTLDARRLLAESVPIGGIVLFWVVVSWFAGGGFVGTGTRLAGVVMALLYAVGRGTALSRSLDDPLRLDDTEALLRANVTVLLAAGAWLLAARLVTVLELVYFEVLHVLFSATVGGDVVRRMFTTPIDGLTFALTVTGVVTVVLYAVAVGTVLVREGPPSGDRGSASAAPADD